MDGQEYVGKIFQHAGGPGWWKITGPKRLLSYAKYGSYPVIKCTSTGREFKQTNSFTASYIETQAVLYDSVSNGKVLQDGIEAGRIKRRMSFLEARIADDNKELEQLKKRLDTLVK